ncbi:GDSL-type esterase/lipase family protein [Streptomyces violascens]|uniref:GDSL-type esterase/lipase family protein n=1 Tax=Streptomyces violascens TaxID=67381 RepID=UPI003660EE84
MPSSARKRRSTLLDATALATALTALVAPAAHADNGYGPYVALGDSYAAGAGVPGQSAGLCLRSDHNYGHLVADSLGVSTYTDVTCSAAKVKAITSPQYDATIKVNGPQIDAVKTDTKLVTIGIGGNDLSTSDLGIGEVIATCIGGAAANPLGTPATTCTHTDTGAGGGGCTGRTPWPSA